MTKKDYQALAKTLVEVKPLIYEKDPYGHTYMAIVCEFAATLQYHNERFNRTKFIEACTGKQSR